MVSDGNIQTTGELMNEAVRVEMEKLRGEKVNVLRARYRELFGEESESSSATHLLRRIAWRLQAAAQGDLTDRARQRAAELIADADLRLNTRRKVSPPSAVKASTGWHDRRVPPVGTVLEREFQGHVIAVRVLEAGFEYDGRKFDSLSAVACQVTGTRWNGFDFFRLNSSGSTRSPKHD